MDRDFSLMNVPPASPSCLRRLIMPARRLMLRVLKPSMQKHEAMAHQFQDQIDEINRQQQALGQQLAELDRRLRSLDAMGWDLVAVRQRLAAIEDRLQAHDSSQPVA